MRKLLIAGKLALVSKNENMINILKGKRKGKPLSRITTSISSLAGATTMALGTAASPFRAEAASMNAQHFSSSKLTPTELPPNLGKGTYVLILQLKRNRRIKIGRRKDSSPILFRAGYYTYVGSAFGPSGLGSRIRRHLRKDKKSVWNIDYLCEVAEPVEVWICSSEKRRERE